jgi:hypothetical protein
MWKQSQKKNSTQRVLDAYQLYTISEFISDLSSLEIARLSMIRQCKDNDFLPTNKNITNRFGIFVEILNVFVYERKQYENERISGLLALS